MKLLVLLTLVGFCTCQAAVSAQNSKITLSATNTTLASVFRQIEQLTDYMFIYKSGDIAPFTDITIDRRQTEVNRILDECLSGTGLSYTFKDNLIIIQGATQQAEEKKVNGKITDRQGHPLPGVTVMIKGTQMGVVTDANGKYTIALPDAKDIFLRFTFIGMKPQEIAYTGQKEINVTLHEEATEMDEVVVTGYQVIDKRKNTSAVTTVKVDDIMIPAATSTIDVKSLRAKCYEAMNDDLNSPIVIAHLFDGAKMVNNILAGNDSITAEDLKELKETFHLFCFDILGLQEDNASNEEREAAFGKVVDMLLEERSKAKANKDWATSDKIRNELTALGFEIKDGKDGSEWKLNK